MQRARAKKQWIFRILASSRSFCQECDLTVNYFVAWSIVFLSSSLKGIRGDQLTRSRSNAEPEIPVCITSKISNISTPLRSLLF